MHWQPRDWRGRFASPARWEMFKPPLVFRPPCGRCRLLEMLRSDPTFFELPNGAWGLTDWYRDRPGFKKLQAERSSHTAPSPPAPST